ncbi:hypothetical protein [Streptomyces sp. DT195]|uniref:hypothetical protein n=1 Tax=Streptomyces sp. DT195 TaxID=3393419 RepID=UPI003CF1F914
MSSLTRPVAALVPPHGRGLPTRGPAFRPGSDAPAAAMSREALSAWRADINRIASEGSGDGLSVVLYALTRPGGDPHGDLATAQGYADAQQLVVVDRIFDVVAGDDHPCVVDPALRRGYARALHLMGDPSSPVRGLVAVSRTAVTPADRTYRDQLALCAARGTALHLVRGETAM